MPDYTSYATLADLATDFRAKLQRKRLILLYAYNGTGKTRLSAEFKNQGKERDEEGSFSSDTLYYNAFTEDLFTWDNDLENDLVRVLELNVSSRFFDGIRELEMEVKVGALLGRYANFNFYIDYDRKKPQRNGSEELLKPAVTFFRERTSDGDPVPIKISRGEENIFIWCFFLAFLQLALDRDADNPGPYGWVKYVYIDDPVSSLDEHNAIVVANHLAQLLRESSSELPIVVSTHHHLFFNVLHYEAKNHLSRDQVLQYVLSRDRTTSGYRLFPLKGDTPSFQHVAALVELAEIAAENEVHTYHFNVLRTVLEKTALFHGYTHFGKCIKRDADDADGILHQRFVDLLSHGKYSLYDPKEMGEETMTYFKTILGGFIERFPFNPDLFPTRPNSSKDL